MTAFATIFLRHGFVNDSLNLSLLKALGALNVQLIMLLLNLDDWNAVVPSVLQLVSSSLQAPVQQQTIRVYVSAPSSMQREVDLLKQVTEVL